MKVKYLHQIRSKEHFLMLERLQGLPNINKGKTKTKSYSALRSVPLHFHFGHLKDTFVTGVMLCMGRGEVWTNESWVFCRRWRVTQPAWHWSGVCSTTEAPEQRRVATSLVDLCLLSAMALPVGPLMQQSELLALGRLFSQENREFVEA